MTRGLKKSEMDTRFILFRPQSTKTLARLVLTHSLDCFFGVHIVLKHTQIRLDVQCLHKMPKKSNCLKYNVTAVEIGMVLDCNKTTLDKSLMA